MSMYIVHNPDDHRCELPALTSRWADGSWGVTMRESIDRVVRLNLGAVIGCHTCNARYDLKSDPLKGGELFWEKDKNAD